MVVKFKSCLFYGLIRGRIVTTKGKKCVDVITKTKLDFNDSVLPFKFCYLIFTKMTFLNCPLPIYQYILLIMPLRPVKTEL